jgi:hypothetical protein
MHQGSTAFPTHQLECACWTCCEVKMHVLVEATLAPGCNVCVWIRMSAAACSLKTVVCMQTIAAGVLVVVVVMVV